MAKRKKRGKRRVLYERPAGLPSNVRIIDMEAERAKQELAAFEETKRQRMLTHGLNGDDTADVKFAGSQECGHSIGRLARQLKWDRETAASRIGAGFRFAEIVVEYNKDVLGAPNPNPKAMDMNRIGGKSTREIGQDRVKSLTNDYMRLIGALEMAAIDGRAGKMHLFRIMSLACIEDIGCENWPDRQVSDLIRALDAVAAGC